MRVPVSLVLILLLVTACGPSTEGPASDEIVDVEEQEKADDRPTLTGYQRVKPSAASVLASLFQDADIQKHFSDADLEVLRGADTVSIFLTDGDEDPADDDVVFPDLEWTRRVTIGETEDRETLTVALTSSIAKSDGSGARCFNPMHGIRFQRGTETVDLVVCLGCRRFMVAGPKGDELTQEQRFGTLDWNLKSAVTELCSKYAGSDTGGC